MKTDMFLDDDTRRLLTRQRESIIELRAIYRKVEKGRSGGSAIVEFLVSTDRMLESTVASNNCIAMQYLL